MSESELQKAFQDLNLRLKDCIILPKQVEVIAGEDIGNPATGSGAFVYIGEDGKAYNSTPVASYDIRKAYRQIMGLEPPANDPDTPPAGVAARDLAVVLAPGDDPQPIIVSR